LGSGDSTDLQEAQIGSGVALQSRFPHLTQASFTRQHFGHEVASAGISAPHHAQFCFCPVLSSGSETWGPAPASSAAFLRASAIAFAVMPPPVAPIMAVMIAWTLPVRMQSSSSPLGMFTKFLTFWT
jgi:hypothetical protein